MKTDDIREHMPIVCSEGTRFAEVGAVEGIFLRAADFQGIPHWFPLWWITAVDSSVHLDRTGQQTKDEWSNYPPIG